MDVEINPNQQRPSHHYNPHRRNKNNSILYVILTGLLCFLTIGVAVWGYFIFVKNVSIVDGLASWHKSAKQFLGLNEENQQVTRRTKYVIVDNRKKEKNNYLPQKHSSTKPNNYNPPKAYRPKSEKNTAHISTNKQSPKAPSPSLQKKLNQLARETKYTRRGESILIPVKITNNRITKDVSFELNHKVKHTQINPEFLRWIGVINRNGKASKRPYTKIDVLQIGPCKERGFLVSTNYEKKKHGVEGVIGRDFRVMLKSGV